MASATGGTRGARSASMRAVCLVSAALLSLMLACKSVTGATEPDQRAAQEAPSVASTDPSSLGGTGVPGVPGPLIAAVKQDAAAKAKAQPSEVQVVAVAPVDWPDSGLGCHEPGRMYAQIVTPGYRITVEVRGQRSEYHTDRASRWVTC